MTAYLRLARSLSLLSRSKCLAIVDTFVPTPCGVRLMVGFALPPEVERGKGLSRPIPREDAFPRVIFPPEDPGGDFAEGGGDDAEPEGSPNLALCFSGDG